MISAQADALMWSIKYNIERTIESACKSGYKNREERLFYMITVEFSYYFMLQGMWLSELVHKKSWQSDIILLSYILNYYTEK